MRYLANTIVVQLTINVLNYLNRTNMKKNRINRTNRGLKCERKYEKYKSKCYLWK